MEKNYDLPVDHELFPEGTKRCSFSKFSVWMAVVGVVLAWGVYAAFRVLRYGLGETALDDYFGFGLWITFDLAVIALGAGAFFTGLLRYILNIDPLKHIINLAVIIGFICYSGAMLILVLDIGQPLRAWFGYWHANVHSMLTEVIFCITCYCIVLIIEYIPLILEQRQLNKIPFLHHLAHNLHVVMPLFAGVGAFLSTFHQGSLGGMYGVLFGRPYVLRDGFFIWPWTFFLFVISAVGSGPVFTVLVATLMEKMTGKKLVSWEVKSLMGKIAGTMLAVYLVFKFADTWAWATDVLPRSGLTFDQNFFGTIYGKWLLWAELGLCGVIPAIMLLTPSLRNRPGLFYTAAILDCVGITINRYVFTVQALAMPVMPFDTWETYNPNWAEWGASAMVIAYGAIILSLSYRYLPVFPQEKKLNAE
ncbi:polysulphide reductase NrfD [Oleidesulfovibrio alaskensis G20]|jgi:molybdopterin-containing oxidoreductase family membrane subunit|uniref:Polysulphide reductase NrfD n=1 Tax=Oleidesulfovibrio alaskensis (strain ATCC BAA-1058 / DSM 17464 / G20) TaxID=207559 RepID=Q30X67_OLEA2|nr:menaquinone reductase integral membrane subunit QrcD [Oleidesulfovibrio alaskensis]ABB39729.1 polysulphide reductase NrfD [Oleidesulfovibrio alaskensis G20]MBG0774651.1 polysulfide reductase NrfD [Oleidesulfovibrio alaskensis]MBL3582048.1 polysulfide reductase NrfD [Oleidesulfovibrio alaskensis]